jgi:hypothetical protein
MVASAPTLNKQELADQVKARRQMQSSTEMRAQRTGAHRSTGRGFNREHEEWGRCGTKTLGFIKQGERIGMRNLSRSRLSHASISGSTPMGMAVLANCSDEGTVLGSSSCCTVPPGSRERRRGKERLGQGGTTARGRWEASRERELWRWGGGGGPGRVRAGWQGEKEREHGSAGLRRERWWWWPAGGWEWEWGVRVWAGRRRSERSGGC